MKKIGFLFAFFLAMFVGYGPSWAGYWIGWILGSEQIRILGTVNSYQVPCASPSTEKALCTHAYLITPDTYSRWGNDAAIGAGQIISATRFSCVEAPERNVSFDDPSSPGRTFEIFSTYQTVALSTLNCKQGVLIEAWSRKTAFRKGHIGGTLTVGHFAAVDRVKKLSEFFTMHALFGLSILFGILVVLSNTLQRYTDKQEIPHPFETTLPIWLLNILILSGLMQTFLAFIQLPQLYNRISMFLFQFGMVTIPILLLKFNSAIRFQRQMVISAAALLLVMASASKDFVYLFQPLNILLTSIVLGIAIIQRRIELLLMGISISLEVMHIYSIPYTPSGTSIYPYYAFAVTSILLSKIQLNTRLAALGRWAQSSDWRRKNTDLLPLLLDKIHSEVGAGRTTLLSISEVGHVRIFTKCGDAPMESIVRNELPPVFAHVFSVREALFHVDAKGEKYRHIVRGALSNQRYQNNLFTILPIVSESQTVGAIAFTDYPSTWKESESRNFLIRYLTKTLESTLVEQIASYDLKARGYWSRRLMEIQKALPTVRNLAEFHELICDRLECFGFLASLEPTSRLFSLHAIRGYPAEVDERLRNGRIYAHKENEQGPIALAANQCKPVIIPDVKLLRSVLHENTNLFFEKSGTRSCAAIPIFSPGKALWGVLFLERGAIDAFTLEATSVLEQIAAELSDLLSRIEQNKVTEQALRALSDFVPQRILDRVINEGLEREEDRGLFVMIDLKNSTKISLETGSEVWLKNARALTPALEAAASRHGLTWQYFNWDAFYFTRSAEVPNPEHLRSVRAFYQEVLPVIRDLYCREYGNTGDYSLGATPIARLCITFGEISRGFQQGATRVWTIVGSEMAAMSKLEDLCKRLDGTLFCDESLQSVLDNDWLDTCQIVPSSERRVYRFRDSLHLHEKKDLGVHNKNRAA